jgi:hypothetical protein
MPAGTDSARFGSDGRLRLPAPVTQERQPGYDPRTGLFVASKVDLLPVPDKPSGEQVAAARTFLLDRFLSDFPWKGDADRANWPRSREGAGPFRRRARTWSTPT